MKLKPQCGYWDTTHYPIGGCFRRAGSNGKEIEEILREITPSYRGCSLEVRFADDTTGAIDSVHTIPDDDDSDTPDYSDSSPCGGCGHVSDACVCDDT